MRNGHGATDKSRSGAAGGRPDGSRAMGPLHHLSWLDLPDLQPPKLKFVSHRHAPIAVPFLHIVIK